MVYEMESGYCPLRQKVDAMVESGELEARVELNAEVMALFMNICGKPQAKSSVRVVSPEELQWQYDRFYDRFPRVPKRVNHSTGNPLFDALAQRASAKSSVKLVSDPNSLRFPY